MLFRSTEVQSVNILEVNKDVQAQREKAENQPANNQPIWKSANSDQAHYVSIPNKEAGVLIQKSGQQWRLIRNGVITVWGGWLLVIAAGLILTVFVVKGKIKLKEPMTGRLMKRFSTFERFSHWLMAFSFLALAISGLLILFGKHFLLPIMGGTAYGAPGSHRRGSASPARKGSSSRRPCCTSSGLQLGRSASGMVRMSDSLARGRDFNSSCRCFTLTW